MPGVHPPRRVRGKRWCFTLNNYTALETFHLEEERNAFSYLLFGKEFAPMTRTPHLQGYFETPNVISFRNCRLLPGLERGIVHFELKTSDQGVILPIPEIRNLLTFLLSCDY